MDRPGQGRAGPPAEGHLWSEPSGFPRDAGPHGARFSVVLQMSLQIEMFMWNFPGIFTHVLWANKEMRGSPAWAPEPWAT